MKKRYTEAEIVGFLQQASRGSSVKALSREHGFSMASFYSWKSRYGGMKVDEVKRLRQLELENARLKRKLAEVVLDNDVLQEVLAKKF
jgi:putative transposase